MLAMSSVDFLILATYMLNKDTLGVKGVCDQKIFWSHAYSFYTEQLTNLWNIMISQPVKS